MEITDVSISSLIDTWLLLRDIEIGGERNSGLYVLKSRGMAHSNQIREFKLSDNGIELLDVYVGPEGVLTGSARLSQEAKDEAEQIKRINRKSRRKQFGLERKRCQWKLRLRICAPNLKQKNQKLLKIIKYGKSQN